MRRWLCAPMILLCLLLCGCGGEREKSEAETARQPYQEMTGCTMTAKVTCGAVSEDALSFTLACTFVPGGRCTVEVLEPESIAGIQAELDGETLALRYNGLCLNIGTFGQEKISPLELLPRLMNALRDGWLLEENREDYGEEPCLRLSLDQTKTQGSEIISTLWLRRSDGVPVHGELSVDGEIILQTEFTDFQFGAILKEAG